MQNVQETPVRPDEVPLPAELRSAALDHFVAELMQQGWVSETKPDNERVLVGRNEFRRLLVQRRWIRDRREVVDIDVHGQITVTSL